MKTVLAQKIPFVLVKYYSLKSTVHSNAITIFEGLDFHEFNLEIFTIFSARHITLAAV